jgi:hypothetical protein
LPKAGVSIREFARLANCSHTLVQKAIKSGHLGAFPDGSLDPTLVSSGWRAANRRGNAEVAVAAGETADEAAERILSAIGASWSLAEAERIKENYLALLRQLEYDTKAAAVVPVDAVAKRVGAEFARVRTRLLAIPAEQAPRLHRCRTIPELQDALMEVIVEALQELTADGDARAA